ncbi:MAG: autotransporter-associated beta strand repeat-containing protein [Pirellulales bacterium]|nr:autotransporter-associated beta strand repeat-containing protein [Pirellulales bacterium]
MRFVTNRLSQGIWIVTFALMGLISSDHGVAETFDWRNVADNNWNTPVRTQVWGTCWAYGAIAPLEAKYKITRNDPFFDIDLSEEQLFVETVPMDFGCTNGGGYWTVEQPYSYFCSHGIVTEAELPAIGDEFNGTDPRDVGLWPLSAGWSNRVVMGVSYATSTYSLEQAKSDLRMYGPRTISIMGGGHVVAIVGYNADESLPGGGYWIYKNSWGPDQGDGGYNTINFDDPECNHDMTSLTGAVYTTGPMYYSGSDQTDPANFHTGTDATVTWKGTSGNVWDTATPDWNNNGSGQPFTWVNQELEAVFDGTGGNRAMTIGGTAIARGMTFNAAGYSISGGSLTITAGGIDANEDVTINSPVTIGGPQAWIVATGKTLTVGAIHTVISDLTITGSGNTVITGAIDGGGVINIYGGAAPGNIKKTGVGTLSFTGASNYSGNVNATGGTLHFAPPSGVTATFSGVISGNRPVTKTDAGTTVFSSLANSYTGSTTISEGALQADDGDGLSSGSYLYLDGGVLQSNSTATFTRTLSSSTSSNRFRWTASGGGFSAGAGPMTVRVNNSAGMLAWGATVGSQIVGILKFGSESAANVVDFQNGINLNGAGRTIQVDDNLNTDADYAIVSGAISNITGTAGPLKTGPGVLRLTGSNTYNGATTISAGALEAEFGAGIPAASLLCLDGGVFQPISSTTFTCGLGSSGGTFQWTVNGGGFSAGAHPLTVNVGGGSSALAWGDTVGSQIVGPLKFGSTTAAAVVTFLNPVDLNGADRTIHVDDNLATTNDHADVSGIISNGAGTAGIIKTGPGLLVLSGANTYNGATTIGGGALQADFGTGIPAAGFLRLDGGVLQNNGAGTLSFTRSLGTGGATFQWATGGGGFSAGTGPMNVNVGGGVNLTWGSTVGSQIVGPLILGSTTAQNVTTFQNNINLGGGDRIMQIYDNSHSSADYVVFSGAISGSGSLTKTGLGTLRLTGTSNSYGGATTVTGGNLELAMTSGPAIPGSLNIAASDGPTNVLVQASNQISSSTALTFSGEYASTFRLLGHSLTLTGISDSLGAGVIENTEGETAGNVTLTVNNSTDCFFSGALRNTNTGSGTLALIKTGSGQLTLSGEKIAYTGGTSVSGGGRLVLHNVTDADFLSKIISNSASTLEFNTANANVAFTGALAGSGSLVKSGLCTLTLGSTTSYSGGTTISDGTLVLQNVTNATFLTKNIVNSGVLELNYTASDVNFSGVISGSGALKISGTKSLTLSGSSANTYTGTTTLTGGTLLLDKTTGPAIPGNLNQSAPNDSTWVIFKQADQIPASAVVTFEGGYWPHFLVYGQTVTVAGISDLYGTACIENTQGQTGIGNGKLIVDNSADYLYYGILRDAWGGSGTFALEKRGSGTLTLLGESTGQYTGGLTVQGGTLDHSGGTLPVCSYYINGGTLDIGGQSQSIPGFQIDSGAVNGSGTLTLSSGRFTLYGGAVSAVLAGSSRTLWKQGAATAILANNNTYTGATSVWNGTLQLGAGSTTGSVAGNISVYASGTLCVNRSNSLTFSSKVSGAGTLTKNGSGTLIMSGANTFSGHLTVNSGTLDYCLNSTLPAGNYTITGGILDIGTLSQSIGVFQITGGSVAGSGTLTSSSAYDVRGGTVGAVLAGSSGLVKTQSGWATLEGVNIYSGDTLIDDGTLVLAETGQINSLSEIINDATFVVDGGTHSLGNVWGTGAMQVASDAQITVSSIVQGTLTIGGVPPSTGGAASQPVPEPGVFVLLLSSAVFLGLRFLAKPR